MCVQLQHVTRAGPGFCNKSRQNMLAFAPLFFAAVLGFGAAHGGPGHSCMHDTIVEGARQSWRTAGEPDRFVIQEHDLTQPGSHNSQTSRSLLSYSNIRIKIMTDLLVDGAYVSPRSLTVFPQVLLVPSGCGTGADQVLLLCFPPVSATVRSYVRAQQQIPARLWRVLGNPPLWLPRFRAPRMTSCTWATPSTISS
jgi:hypothetical protein